MCHHGSLKKWTPFARASALYDEYKKSDSTMVSSEVFKYNKEIAEPIARDLEIDPKSIKLQLLLYVICSKLINICQHKSYPKKLEFNQDVIHFFQIYITTNTQL